MGFNVAGEYFEFDVAVVVDCRDASDSRIGVPVADHDVSIEDNVKSRSCITRSGPEVLVIRHVHEVDGDLVRIGHGADRTLRFARGGS